jgi:hypothetical protein
LKASNSDALWEDYKWNSTEEPFLDRRQRPQVC